MNLSAKKIAVIVLVLCLVLGFVLFNHQQKPKSVAWVNTASMPGQTFAQHTVATKSDDGIIHLGSSSYNDSEGFGPKDVSFDFKDLK